MKKNHILFVLLTIVAIFVSSCETKKDDPTDTTPDDSTNAVIVEGKVVSAETGDNLEGAIIKITNGSIVKGTTTNSDGEYSTSFEMDSDGDLTIIAFKAGYFQDTTNVFAIINSTVDVPLFQLQRDESSNAGGFSGKAASIYLFSQSAEFIGVKESGSLESAQIVFEIMDSSGVVIGEENAINVSFRFGSTPGGGEYLYPSSIMTNALGKAAVSLNTGTVAGVSQIIAEAVVDGKPIASKPINIAIHGGFPDLAHFSIASNQLNYAYYHWIGKRAIITVLMGDKYSNPVRPNTTVYFNSDAAVVQGSSITDDLGLASVELVSGYPLPNDPTYGPGFFYVNAKTINETEDFIEAKTRILFSGVPVVTLSPLTIDIANGGSQSFSYTVTDEFGNPLAPSNNYSVEVETGGTAEAAGDVSISMPDAQFGYTNFSFSVIDTDPEKNEAAAITVTVKVNGPNGIASISASGVTR
ncbi:MAG: hypothetical protein KDC88_01915 [Ignavibacteriae bacterium]|nr:hypothetical protein [Ignavibacteriota bacterium]MCB9207741.1 hypothetical protein [Ignavibacteriales bacterium]MCB9258511.1 hypothetical protein [Ignavibacteriales bacterium]